MLKPVALWCSSRPSSANTHWWPSVNMLLFQKIHLKIRVSSIYSLTQNTIYNVLRLRTTLHKNICILSVEMEQSGRRCVLVFYPLFFGLLFFISQTWGRIHYWESPRCKQSGNEGCGCPFLPVTVSWSQNPSKSTASPRHSPWEANPGLSLQKNCGVMETAVETA